MNVLIKFLKFDENCHHFFQVMDFTQNNRIDDVGKKVQSVLTDEQFCILYAICHVTGMLSACANPVIYGYLNENFNREFKEIFARIKWACPCMELLSKLWSSMTKGIRRDNKNSIEEDEQMELNPMLENNQGNGKVTDDVEKAENGKNPT